MPYLVFDTETTGLPQWHMPAEAECQPRLASWAMLFVDDEMRITEGWHGLVRPDGWTMPPEATAINGLTNERLMAEGQDIRLPVHLLSEAIEQKFVLVAHNLSFDTKIMRGEFRRLGDFSAAKYCRDGICTMLRLTGACAIPGKLGRCKWPRLEEACRIILGQELHGAHTALADTIACWKLLRAMHGRGLIERKAA